MRSEEEIREMIKRIDDVIDIKNLEKYNRLRRDKDFKYCCDIKAILQLVLEKMSMEQEGTSIEEKMREIVNKCIDDMNDDELKQYIEFIDEEFGESYNGRDPYDTCNVVDAFDWILEDISTEDFLSSSYTNLEGLRKKVKGKEPICVEKTKGEKAISLREIAPEEKKELLEIIDQMAKLIERIHKIREKQREIWDKQRVIRAKHMKNISIVKDEKGKSIYPNKDSRTAELTLRLKKDEENRVLEERYRKLRDEMARLSIEYNRLVDRKAILTGVFLEDEKIRVY